MIRTKLRLARSVHGSKGGNVTAVAERAVPVIGRRDAVRGLVAVCVGAVTPRSAFAKTAPYAQVRLRDTDGQETSLRRQADGHNLVVVVMKGHWCPVCAEELQRFAAKRAELDGLDAVVVGLNADSHKANRAMAQRKQIPFQVLSDKGHHVIDELGLWLPELELPMPAVLVFDRCGKERGRRIGRGSTGFATKETLKFLRELQKEKPACGDNNA